jgi:transposase
MTDHDLYQQILGLSSPWRVSGVELLLAQDEVLVHVVHDPALGKALCPECQTASPGYDSSEERRWRHLDTCQLKTYLVCQVPRIQCPVHGVRTAYLPWTEPKSRFTLAFESLAISVLRATVAQNKAADLLRLTPSQIHDLMHRAVARGMERRDADEIMKHLGIDEKSIHKGHSYMSILSDTDNRRVVEVTQGRTTEAARALFETGVIEKQRPFVESVSMDMWQAFQNAKECVLPEADLVHDRFHVVMHLSDAVDLTRRSEQKELSKEGDKTLSKSKYIWLRNPEHMTDKQKELLATLRLSELKTAQAWAFKDAFQEFFLCTDIAQGQAFFENWYAGAIALGNRYLTKVADMLQGHLDGLLNYLKHRVNNATAEGLNSQIQHIKASARGYRKFENFRVAILFHLGKLDLYPHNSL